MLDYKLTDAEIWQAMKSIPNGEMIELTPWELKIDRAVADAAADKALRAVVAWLRGDAAASSPPDWGEVLLDAACLLEQELDQGPR